METGLAGRRLADLSRIWRVVGIVDGDAAYAGVLAGDLVLEERDWLEARIGLRSGNRSDIRSRFSP